MESVPALLSDDGLFAAVVGHRGVRARIPPAPPPGIGGSVAARPGHGHLPAVDEGEPGGREAVDRAGQPVHAVITPTGQPLGPLHSATGSALAEHDLSDGHLRELTRAITKLRLPDDSEPILVDAALSLEPKSVRQSADRIRDRIDQDGIDELDEPAAEPADVLYVRDLPGGRVEFWGELSAETGARFTAMLEPLSQPRPDGPKDRAHRLREAFGDLVGLASRYERLPSEAGERPHISVTVDFETLRRGVGHAVLDGDHYLSEAQARRIACNAKIIPVVMGGDSEVLDPGRTKRTVNVAQRKALHARDRGCAFPGCSRPPKWTDAHHVRHWADGGDTDLGNLVLLCRAHHSLVHHSQWSITMTGGVPVFIPPRHVDPAQLPRQNLLHRPPVAIAA